MRSRQRLAWAPLGVILAGGLAGCGTPGAPQPPSLNLPDRVTDLSATRAGNRVSLNWSMPRKNTDKLILKNGIAVRVCREEVANICVDAGSLVFAPGADASWSESLPPALMQGQPRELHYFVELKSHAGRSAGLSNESVVLAGAPPTPVANLRVEMRKQGAVLHWTQDDDSAAIRLHRTLLTPPATKPKEGLAAPPPEAVQQNFLIEKVEQGQALDKTIRFGETYEYRAQRVTRISVDGKTLELPGELSGPIRVDAQDVFPPNVPTGLVAIATVPQNGRVAAIDLSWEPDSEADVAGYVVYRHEAGETWQRISPPEPVVGPAFHDTQVQPGHTYMYAVCALDQGGHESARSAETQEAVPASKP
ncbi:MAG TPA: fibronectin type III domain-containing protein [Terracidiphilus sp.]|nr:fibronectin type III domain-containing protein [Terracidiphilus sp.]